MPKRILTDQEEKEIAKIYLSGKTMNEIADGYNLGIKTIRNALYRTNTPRRERGSNSYRIYNLDENIFDIVDTPEKAYWLGFLYADGNVCNGSIRLHLKIGDRKHIEKFKSFLKSEHKIIDRESFHKKHNKTYKKSCFNIHSKYLSNRLENLGITVGRINFSLEEIPENLYHHWIAGFFDGDGSISTRNFPRVIFCAPKTDVLEFVKEQLSPLTDKYNKRTKEKRICTHKNSGIYYLYYNGVNISKEIYEYMYENAPVFLERKKKKFMEFV